MIAKNAAHAITCVHTSHHQQIIHVYSTCGWNHMKEIITNQHRLSKVNHP